MRHFGKDVRLYEIWNEWDIGIGLPKPYRKGGSPEDYVRLLKAVYPRIKAVDPDVTVIAGASTSGGVKKGWLEAIVKLGALDYCDAISIHSYNYNEKFPQRGPEACSTWMKTLPQEWPTRWALTASRQTWFWRADRSTSTVKGCC